MSMVKGDEPVKNFHVCPRCEENTIHVSMKSCSWCEPPEPQVPMPCFQCGGLLGVEDTTGSHHYRDKCIETLRKQHGAALREIARLKHMIGRENPVKCGSCGEIRERAEQMCGNCGAELH